MNEKVVAPRLTPPAPDSRGSSGLPDDILSDQARRIVVFSGVAAFVWCFGLSMDGLVLPATIGVTAAPSALVLESIASVVNLAMFVYYGSSICTPTPSVALAYG